MNVVRPEPGTCCGWCRQPFSVPQQRTPGLVVASPLGPVHAIRCLRIVETYRAQLLVAELLASMNLNPRERH